MVDFLVSWLANSHRFLSPIIYWILNEHFRLELHSYCAAKVSQSHHQVFSRFSAFGNIFKARLGSSHLLAVGPQEAYNRQRVYKSANERKEAPKSDKKLQRVTKALMSGKNRQKAPLSAKKRYQKR